MKEIEAKEIEEEEIEVAKKAATGLLVAAKKIKSKVIVCYQVIVCYVGRNDSAS